jgi:hypothetical protein
MNYLVRSKATLPKPRPWTVTRPEQHYSKPKELDVVTRRYCVQWLSASGNAESRTMVAPALPAFEQAFNAFAQGTLIQTEHGKVAVEDLRPGDRVATADGGLQTLMWIGAMTLFPQQADLGLSSSHLYRITENIFGLDRSAPDLMLGAAARLLPGLFAVDSSSSLVDIADLADGHSVIRVRPMSAVRTFHLGLDGHRLVRANGIACESFHPGENAHLDHSPEMFGIYMSLLPHVKSFDDFGPLFHKRTS